MPLQTWPQAPPLQKCAFLVGKSPAPPFSLANFCVAERRHCFVTRAEASCVCARARAIIARLVAFKFLTQIGVKFLALLDANRSLQMSTTFKLSPCSSSATTSQQQTLAVQPPRCCNLGSEPHIRRQRQTADDMAATTSSCALDTSMPRSQLSSALCSHRFALLSCDRLARPLAASRRPANLRRKSFAANFSFPILLVVAFFAALCTQQASARAIGE